MTPTPIVILGLDGATLELIEPWAAQGKLPNLARLMAEGAYGELRSTIPAVTAPAWTSFATGKNPGKHGIYDFVTLDVATDQLTYSNSSHCQGEPLWDVLSRHGKRVCVVNVPMTYPPHPVHGILITGMMTPGLDSKFVYPEELQRELRSRFPNYVISAPADKDMANYPKSLLKMVDARAELIMHLLQRETWDFFMGVFTATDLVQHMFWRAMIEPGHPQTDAILSIYQRIDARIGEIREILPPETCLLLMSDHGAGPIRKQVHINRWLQEQGYLAYHTSDEPLHRRWLKRLLVKAFIFWRTKIPLSVRTRIRDLSPKLQDIGVSERVEAMATVPFDWTRTHAYHAGTYGCVRINLRGRERHGIVAPGAEYDAVCEKIRQQLTELIDPDTGRPVVARTYRREEVYEGDALSNAPDLLIEWNDEAYWSDARFGKQSEQVFEDQYKVPLLTTAISAIHKRNGIFMAAGPDIQPQRLSGTDITDVAPTVLHRMRVPLPHDMDGQATMQIFKEDPGEIQYEEARATSQGDSDDVFSDDDREKVEGRLRDLGYLG